MNGYNSNSNNRKSIRLKGFDYSREELYFITICCQNREHLFGKISPLRSLTEKDIIEIQKSDAKAIMMLNDAGRLVEAEWLALTDRFLNVKLHEFIVMPNHFHGIIEIISMEVASDKTVGDFVGAFKSITTVSYIRGVKTMNWKPFNQKLWQRDYYENIIRNENAFDNIANYIMNNPKKWQEDKFYKP